MTDDALIEAVRLAIAKAYEESDGDGPLFLDEALAALAAARPVIRAQALEAAAEITVGCCIECYAAILALKEVT